MKYLRSSEVWYSCTLEGRGLDWSLLIVGGLGGGDTGEVRGGTCLDQLRA